MAEITPHGHVRVEVRAKGRVWVAEYQLADGNRTRKTLGPAWVRNSGRTTSRGAILWRAGNGSKPDERHLTPAEAQELLTALLEAERQRPTARREKGKTFGDAIDAFLHRAEFVVGIEETTLRGYKVMAGKLRQEFGADTPLRKLTTERIDAYQTKWNGPRLMDS